MDANQVAQQLFDAIQVKHWQYATIAGLVLIVSLIRKYASKIHGGFGAWLNTDKGGSVLVVVSGVLMSLLTAAKAGHLSVGQIENGIVQALMASGAWNVFWDLITKSPKPAAAPAVPPPTPPVAALLPFFFVLSLFSLSGCADVMSTYYKSVATGATAVSTGFQLLDKWDSSSQQSITAQAKSDPNGASIRLKDHNSKYDTVRKVLSDASIVVETAKAVGPTVEAAKDRSKQAGDWILRLTKLASDIMTILQQNGVV